MRSVDHWDRALSCDKTWRSKPLHWGPPAGETKRFLCNISIKFGPILGGRELGPGQICQNHLLSWLLPHSNRNTICLQDSSPVMFYAFWTYAHFKVSTPSMLKAAKLCASVGKTYCLNLSAPFLCQVSKLTEKYISTIPISAFSSSRTRCRRCYRSLTLFSATKLRQPPMLKALSWTLLTLARLRWKLLSCPRFLSRKYK